MVTAASIQSAAEALALVHAQGLPLEKFIEAMRVNASYSGTLAMKLPKMLERDFAPHFSVKHMLKDMQIASQIALSHYLDLGVTAAARDQLLEQMQWGHGDDDYSSAVRKYLHEPAAAFYEEAQTEEQREQASTGEPTIESAESEIEKLEPEEPDLREKLHARLERYVIADDVEIEDVTDQFSLFHVLAPESPKQEDGRIVSVRRLEEPGWDIWIDAERHDAMWQQLSSQFAFLDSAAAEMTRIEQGIPRSGSELTEDIIPIEANLEQRTIDYEKGCYIGQEVISRIKMSGQTNKRLCGLISLDDIPLQPGMKLVAPSVPGKEVGWITSATRSETIEKEIALGYVKRGFNSAGTRLAVFAMEGSEPTPVGAIAIEVVPLPFL